MTSTPRPLATPAEVADYLRSTVDSLSQMRVRGAGPSYVKLGHKVLYRWEDVETYVESGLHSHSVWITSSEAQRILGVGRSRIGQLAAGDLLVTRRNGSKWELLRASVEAYKESRKPDWAGIRYEESLARDSSITVPRV